MKSSGRLICWIVLLTTCVSTISAGSVSARVEQTNRAGLVVQFGDGSVFTSCVEFTEPDISAYDVLVRAGLTAEASFDALMGPGVCSINGEGCPASNCFCQCTGVPCIYWVYHHLINGTWQYSNLGAGIYPVHDGEVEGWAWGEGAPTQGVQPPATSFDQICAPEAPTHTPAPPTDTPQPTNTPVPPTATIARPTNTAPAPIPVVWFRLDHNPIAAGECTMVRWDTSGAREVYLDDELVGTTGSREVCPTSGTEYVLRVVSESGEKSETLTLGMIGTVPETSPTPDRTPTPRLIVPEPVPPSSTPVTVSTGIPTATSAPGSAPDPIPSRTPSVTNTPPPALASHATIPTASGTIMREPDQNEQSTANSEASSAFPHRYLVFGAILVGLIGLTTLGGKLWR